MHDILFPIINGFFAVLKSFENIPSILEMLGNLRVIRKSLMKNWEFFGGFRLSQFVSSLTVDHYFWSSGGVPGLTAVKRSTRAQFPP